MSLEYAPRGLVGVLTPQANTTVEPEFGILWPPGVAMVNGRLVSARAAMEDRLVDYYDGLDDSLAQFANAPLAAVAVACTGASYLYGLAREDAMIARIETRLGRPVVTSAVAVVAALRSLGAARIGLVSPYPAALTEASVAYWTARGLVVGAVVGVAPEDAAFHPIYAMRATDAGQALDRLAGERLDAVVMLGTGMPTLGPILARPRVGTAPVLSCMLALAWRSVVALDPDAPERDLLADWIDRPHWRARALERRLGG